MAMTVKKTTIMKYVFNGVADIKIPNNEIKISHKTRYPCST